MVVLEAMGTVRTPSRDSVHKRVLAVVHHQATLLRRGAPSARRDPCKGKSHFLAQKVGVERAEGPFVGFPKGQSPFGYLVFSKYSS